MLWRLCIAIVAGLMGIMTVSLVFSIIAAIIPIMIYGGVFMTIFAIVLVASQKEKPGE